MLTLILVIVVLMALGGNFWSGAPAGAAPILNVVLGVVVLIWLLNILGVARF